MVRRNLRPWLAALAVLLLEAVGRRIGPPAPERPVLRHEAFVLDLGGVGNLLHWVLGEPGGIPYRLVPGNVPFGAEGERAIHDAFASWNRASSVLEYRFDGYTGEGRIANDGRNVVFFVHEDWPYDSSLAALTFRFYDKDTGALLDTDIAFNAADHTWSIGGTDLDVQNSATHEVGHACGLGHSSVVEATMYGRTHPGETIKRTLHEDDVAGLAALYGVDAPSRPSDGISTGGGKGGGSGCTTGPAAGDALFAALTSLALALHGVRRRSHADGRASRDAAPHPKRRRS